jgi:hypothetical protein
MNAARRARKWGHAKRDPALMAEALAEEIDDPATGLVSRDFLRAELTELEGRLNARLAQLETRMVEIETRVNRVEIQLGTRIAELETRLLWRLITVFGIQIALVGVLVAVLVQVLR